MCISVAVTILAVFSAGSSPITAKPADGAPLKKVLNADNPGENLLDPGAWRPWQKGFDKQGSIFFCDNASDAL
ncbi:MAG TPA: hypothetical protein ENI81_01815, partial [Phycisphaerales bacterium]|nr:hypothetical protein [Phycisphaerales bacterium]